MIESRILGVDLSLTSTGLVLLPAGWVGPNGIEWNRVVWDVVGRPLRKTASEAERIYRLYQVTHEIVARATDWGATHVVFEQHAFHQGHQAYSRGELSGAVKISLPDTMAVSMVVASSARKTLLGKCPRSGAKAAALAYVKKLDPPWLRASKEEGYEDLCDAFVVANHEVSRVGQTFVGRAVA